MAAYESIGCFAIVALTAKPGSWWAIDRQENILFEVYQFDNGPDDLKEGFIRIIDRDGKIGFANSKGEVVIRPQFEQASTFHNGYSIIGKNCKRIYWDKHRKKDDCNHYSVDCTQAGYINEKGAVQFMGNATFENIAKKIGWQSE
jgi:hypothetical protein